MIIWLNLHYGWEKYDVLSETLEEGVYLIIKKLFSLSDYNHTKEFKNFEIIINKKLDDNKISTFSYRYSNKNPNEHYLNIFNTYIRKRKINKILQKKNEKNDIFFH